MLNKIITKIFTAIIIIRIIMDFVILFEHIIQIYSYVDVVFTLICMRMKLYTNTHMSD